MESIRDKAVIIKQEAKAIENILDDFKGLDSMYAIEEKLKQAKTTAEEGIEQIRGLQERWHANKPGKRGHK